MKGDGNMRVIFLDFDGVLNTERYLRERDLRIQSILDETKLAILRRIVEETGAMIVLSTSWRRHWDPDPALWDDTWKPCGEALCRHGLTVYDRTPDYGDHSGNNRDREVRDWLTAHKGEVESFVILDDVRMGWEELSERLVNTNPYRGLTEELANEAVQHLRTPVEA